MHFQRAIRAAFGLGLGVCAGACLPDEIPEPTDPPVVLIVVDTMRADRLSLYGAERPTSPALDRWAERAAVFERAHATSSWTVPSFGSLLTGLLPTRHVAGLPVAGSDQRAALQRKARTLGQRLRARGYATGAVVNSPFLRPSFGLNRGFEDYDFETTTNEEIRRADAVVDRALAWIATRGERPFFLMVHLIDPHMTYDPPASVRGRFTAELESGLALPVKDFRAIRSGQLATTPTDQAFVAAAYDEEVLGVDAELDRLLRGLDDAGLLERGLILLTSDHGEELFEHGGFEHGHAMVEEVLRVPLIVWGPGVRARRVLDPVSLVDVLPTVLDAIGEPLPAGLPGVSLWPALTEGAALAPRRIVAEGTLYGTDRRALLRWPHKVIVDLGDSSVRLFDLDADPGERHDLARERPELAKQLADELGRIVRAAREGRQRPVGVEIDATTRAQLQELGYVE